LEHGLGRLLLSYQFGASGEPEDVEGCVRLGVERVLLNPPTLPEAELLRKIDELAGTAGKV